MRGADWFRRLLLGVALGVQGSAGAVEVSPAYGLEEILTTGPPTGGIDVVGNALFVGMGSFGGAAESVVRIDMSGETALADGFNSLAGIVYDALNDQLLVGDNALEAFGAETGDTLYAVPGPFGAFPVPLRARDLELLPAGSTASVADIVLDPADPAQRTLFVSNAVGPPGEILALDLVTSSLTPLQAPLGFTSGIAASIDELFFGLVAPGSFEGQILVTPLPDGTDPAETLVTGLDGLFDLVLASDGSLLATASRFGGPSSLVRIDPVTGDVQEVIASGFDFATVLDEEADEIYVIEGGSLAQNRVLVIPEPPVLSGLMAGVAAMAGFALLRRRAALSRPLWQARPQEEQGDDAAF